MTNSCTSTRNLLFVKYKKGDEIIFQITLTYNCFHCFKGAVPKFAICAQIHSISMKKIIRLINKKTKAIVVNHYGSWL